jgi:uncharacterized membrane protein
VRPARWAAYAGARFLELALIVLGIGFTFVASRPGPKLGYLATWDLVALIYLSTGVLVLRRLRAERNLPVELAAHAPAWSRMLRGPRFNFAFTLAASLTGLGSADAVITSGGDARIGSAIRFFGGMAIIFAWVLLHAGYARFYAGLYYLADKGGLEFPHREQPGPVDFMYFSFTLGTSFAVSDVTVTAPAMRWHVMTHSILCFFYNAIVLAVAIGIVTGR